jgi:predicted amidohydrolase YtcJ
MRTGRTPRCTPRAPAREGSRGIERHASWPVRDAAWPEASPVNVSRPGGAPPSRPRRLAFVSLAFAFLLTACGGIFRDQSEQAEALGARSRPSTSASTSTATSTSSSRPIDTVEPGEVPSQAGASAAAEAPADFVVRGGRVVTLDADGTEVEALAAREGRIVALGSADEIAAWIGPDTEVLEVAPSEVVYPGFIEGHGHFLGVGESARILDLRLARTWREIVDLVVAAAERTPPGEWIEGRGWHQSKWDEPPTPNVEGFPVHDELSALVPDHPVVLRHASGHAAFYNEAAMQLAGIDAASAAPEGGEILRDEDGAATGLFRETAQEVIERTRFARLARRPRAEIVAGLRRDAEAAAEICLRHGITTFEDAGTPLSAIPVLREMAEDGDLPLRLWVMIRDDVGRIRDALARGAFRIEDAGEGFLTVAAVKLTIDGALGPRGAWLLEPYSDAPGQIGLGRTSDLEPLARLCADERLQFCVHAIGDRANRVALDAFEAALRDEPDGRQRRWRIEHAQHLHPDDVPRFAELGVIAAMQGIHCTSDAPYVEARLGAERARTGAYLWRDLLDAGAVIVNGTDAPVEPVDPIASFHASVTRAPADGSREAFYPEQAMTRLEALRSYTTDAAYAAFQEQDKGSLEVGKFADLVVLSQDLLTVPVDRIVATEVRATVVGGIVRYRAEPVGPPSRR